MTLSYYGFPERLWKVRDAMPVGRDGTSARDIARAADRFGLHARVVRVDLADLRLLPPGSILHWNLGHFVVLASHRQGRLTIHDPARGTLRPATRELDASYTGVALVFDRPTTFRARPSRSLVVWGYARSLLANRATLLQIALCSLALQLFAIALPLCSRLLIDRVLPVGDYSLLTAISLGALVLALAAGVSSYLRGHLLGRLRVHFEQSVQSGFVWHLLRLPQDFFALRLSGDLVLRLNGSSALREAMATTAVTAVLDTCTVAACIAVLFSLSPGMAWLTLFLGVTRALVFVIASPKQREAAAGMLGAQAILANYQVQMISGIEAIKSCGAERNTFERCGSLHVDVLNASIDRGRAIATMQAWSDALNLAAPMAILGLGTHLVIAGTISLGGMIAAAGLAGAALLPVATLIAGATSFDTALSYVDRIEDVVCRDTEAVVGTGGGGHPRLSHIDVQGVTYRYSGSTTPALCDVTLTVAAGATLAIVGRSGSGKSTLGKVLAGLLIPDSGQVLYGSVEGSVLGLGHIRRSVGYVPQDPYVFGATIRDNISMDRPHIGLAEVERAATLAGIHADIALWPMRYDTMLAAGGASLSGGQKQRLAIARALVVDPSILVLDESTSSLDSLTEHHVQAQLTRLPCTKVVIAHRLSTIASADVIAVMDGGRIVEQGSHEQLLQRRGAYARLVAGQLKTATMA